jgi:hypothetical protein
MMGESYINNLLIGAHHSLIFAEAIALVFKGLVKTALTPLASTASYKLTHKLPVDSITTASPSESLETNCFMTSKSLLKLNHNIIPINNSSSTPPLAYVYAHIHPLQSPPFTFHFNWLQAANIHPSAKPTTLATQDTAQSERLPQRPVSNRTGQPKRCSENAFIKTETSINAYQFLEIL